MSNKALLQTLLARPIAFFPALGRVAGTANAGLFLSQLFYWAGKGAHPDGWVYKDHKEWTDETTLTQDEQRGARRLLEKKGLIEVSDVRKLRIDKFHSTLCFRINFEVLEECLRHGGAVPKAFAAGDGNFPLRSASDPIPEDAAPHTEVGDSNVHSTQTTSQTTSESSPRRTASGGGVPDLWERAIELEIQREARKNEVRNKGGLRTHILARYRDTGGPSQDVLDDLAVRAAAAERDTHEAAKRAAADAKAKDRSALQPNQRANAEGFARRFARCRQRPVAGDAPSSVDATTCLPP